VCRYGGPRWTAARIGSGGPGDSLRIWPLCACPSSDLSLGRRTGLAHRVDLIRSLSACWRDPVTDVPPGDSTQAGADLGHAIVASGISCDAAGYRNLLLTSV